MSTAIKSAAPKMSAELKKANEDNVKKRFVINIAMGNDEEGEYVFLGGCERGDMRIKRGVDVEVPMEVLKRLDDAVIGVPVKETVDGIETVKFVDRKRFPYTIVGFPNESAAAGQPA